MEHPLYQPNKGENMTKEVNDPSQHGEGFFYAPTMVALTGGPSAGKSTLLNKVTKQLDGVYQAPEIATILLSGGFPAPTEAHPWDEPWQRNFQETVASAQIPLERIAARRAMMEGKDSVVLDRGLLDGAAYLRGGVAELEEITGQDEETMLRRYDIVIHLSSSAVHGAYDKASNPHRFEEAEEAAKLEERTLTAWENHPVRIVLSDADKQTKVAKGLKIIQALGSRAKGKD